MIILADYNLTGQAGWLWGTLAAGGWLDLTPLRLATFEDVALAPNSDDRTVWRFCQERDMLLLTGNRNMEGEDSLEQTIQEENQPTSWLVLTVGNFERMRENAYREDCAERLMEIVLYINQYPGVGRLYIP
jgi:hypothetical protein